MFPTRDGRASSLEPVAAGSAPPHDPTVLVVDDQRAIRLGIGQLLQSIHPRLSVIHAGDATQALDALARHAPDLVVLDVDLDGADGLALLPRLSARARVVVLTSQNDAPTRERAARLGAVALLGKGEPAAWLLRRLAELLPRADVPFFTADPHSREEKRPS